MVHTSLSHISIPSGGLGLGDHPDAPRPVLTSILNLQLEREVWLAINDQWRHYLVFWGGCCSCCKCVCVCVCVCVWGGGGGGGGGGRVMYINLGDMELWLCIQLYRIAQILSG